MKINQPPDFGSLGLFFLFFLFFFYAHKHLRLPLPIPLHSATTCDLPLHFISSPDLSLETQTHISHCLLDFWSVPKTEKGVQSRSHHLSPRSLSSHVLQPGEWPHYALICLLAIFNRFHFMAHIITKNLRLFFCVCDLIPPKKVWYLVTPDGYCCHFLKMIIYGKRSRCP